MHSIKYLSFPRMALSGHGPTYGAERDVGERAIHVGISASAKSGIPRPLGAAGPCLQRPSGDQQVCALT